MQIRGENWKKSVQYGIQVIKCCAELVEKAQKAFLRHVQCVLHSKSVQSGVNEGFVVAQPYLWYTSNVDNSELLQLINFYMPLIKTRILVCKPLLRLQRGQKLMLILLYQSLRIFKWQKIHEGLFQYINVNISSYYFSRKK